MGSLSKLDLAMLAALSQVKKPSNATALVPEIEARLGAPVRRGVVVRRLAKLMDGGLVLVRPHHAARRGIATRFVYRIAAAGRQRLLREMRAFARLTRVRTRLSPLTQAYLKNPPAGSKVAQAKDYGVDINRLSRVLMQAPHERYRDAVDAMRACAKHKGPPV